MICLSLLSKNAFKGQETTLILLRSQPAIQATTRLLRFPPHARGKWTKMGYLVVSGLIFDTLLQRYSLEKDERSCVLGKLLHCRLFKQPRVTNVTGNLRLSPDVQHNHKIPETSVCELSQTPYCFGYSFLQRKCELISCIGML